MNDPFAGATHHLRLGGAERGQGLFPVSRRYGVFHLPHGGAETTETAAIDLGAAFDLPYALLCRLMMSHLSTQLLVPGTIS
jgi:hypothetical protein